MTTLIYCNVTTGECFDSDGTLRTANNPFTAVYGEKRTFEWHLVQSTSSQQPSQWPAAVLGQVPDTAVTASDDNYILAYKAKLTGAVTGQITSIGCTSSAPASNVTPSGMLRFFKSDGTVIETAYTARTVSGTGFVFTVNADFGSAAFASGTEFDIMETPLVRSSMNASASTIASCIFSFDMNFSGWRIREKFCYTDTASLDTKGLELRLAKSVTGGMEEILCIQAPFQITAALNSLYANAVPADGEEAEYQTWTRGLFSQGIMAQFSSDGSTWSSSSDGAEFIRYAPACAPQAACSAIPLGRRQVEYSFAVSSGAGSAVTIPFSSLGASSSFPCSIRKCGASGSETDLTNNPNLAVRFTENALVLKWVDTFPTGNYKVQG